MGGEEQVVPKLSLGIIRRDNLALEVAGATLNSTMGVSDQEKKPEVGS